MHVLGRGAGESGVSGRIGTYRARDGSDGASVALDFERPHAGVVVGKRGYGKSYTLGVVAEEAARTPGVAPVVIDPLGVFGGLAGDSTGSAAETSPGERIESPTVRTDALPPQAWPDLFGLTATDPVGALIWEAASHAATLEGMQAHVGDSDAPDGVRRAAENYLGLAASWDVFDPNGLDPASLTTEGATVLDVAEYGPAPMSAVVAVVARGVYDVCVAGESARLPWLLVDEAHAFFDGLAASALETVYTRGRSPGVSIVSATQRPSALPQVAISQSDLLVAHRLTSVADVEALTAARPTYLDGRLDARLPDEPGTALVVDDATEALHDVRVRRRRTPHGGESARASECAERDDTDAESESAVCGR